MLWAKALNKHLTYDDLTPEEAVVRVITPEEAVAGAHLFPGLLFIYKKKMVLFFLHFFSSKNDFILITLRLLSSKLSTLFL